ncbi:MAG: T9SS type A sorting domain-containing protein [Flavobacteriales bacterium]|nr:T9SS type A sorting domain-containing protein [Flavobacteriales bacterium]
MKHMFFLSLLILSSVFSYGQDYPCYGGFSFWGGYTISFEDTVCGFQFSEESPTDTINIWQIGHPNKTVFTSAYLGSKAIVTDTALPYPINDTSSFVIMNGTGYGFEYGNTVVLAGKYYVNSDSLNDYGIIEFSPDNGTTWIDLINDTVYSQSPNSLYYWYSEKPVLTGNSFGWNEFWVNLAGFKNEFEIQLDDTVLYRFTFISDSIADTLDGLMFDDLHFEDWAEGIEEQKFQNLSSKAYPNPTSSSLTIEFDNTRNQLFQLNIFDALGRVIYSKSATDQRISVPTDGLNSGIYHYTLTNNELSRRASGRFVVRKE